MNPMNPKITNKLVFHPAIARELIVLSYTASASIRIKSAPSSVNVWIAKTMRNTRKQEHKH